MGVNIKKFSWEIVRRLLQGYYKGTRQDVSEISIEETRRLMQKGEPLLLLDVRLLVVRRDRQPRHVREVRLLDFKAIPAGDDLALTVTCYFRSWDLWAGFPTNLGGLELLKAYVASEAGLKNGPLYAYSSGAHIYGYQEDIARIRTLKQK